MRDSIRVRCRGVSRAIPALSQVSIPSRRSCFWTRVFEDYRWCSRGIFGACIYYIEKLLFALPTPTPLRKRSLWTFAFFRCADISAEEYDSMMHRAFLFFTQELFEFFICLFWRASFHNPHTIHHAMDMRIDPYKGHIIEMGEDDFCRLHSDSWERADGFEGVWDFPMKFWDEFLCCHEEMLRLHAIIVHASEHDFDFLGFEPEEIGRSFHQLEESLCCFIDAFVCHLSWEHDRCEELKWSLEIQLNRFCWIELENFSEYFISLRFCAEFHKNSIFKNAEKAQHPFVLFMKKVPKSFRTTKLAINCIRFYFCIHPAQTVHFAIQGKSPVPKPLFCFSP